MSLFFQSNSQLQESLSKLPDDYTSEEITSMYNALQEDLKKTHVNRTFDSLGAKVAHYSENHKKFCLSFPMLFRCTVKGSFTPDMLKIFLATRDSVKKGDIENEEAKNILVDVGVQYTKKSV